MGDLTGDLANSLASKHTKDEHTEGNDVSRRDLLKIFGALAGAATVTEAVSLGISRSQASSGEEGKHKWGMVIDIDLCIGCNYCTFSCSAVNNLSEDMLYNRVTTETTQNGEEYFLSRPCMHCDTPPCVHVCPVKATYVRPDGIVTMNYDLCIGCRYCVVACPYDVRVFNWRLHTETSPRAPAFGTPEVPPRPRGVTEKCTFCQHRIDNGLARGLMPGIDAAATPACIVACPTGSRVFGDLNDPTSPASVRLQASKTPIRLREDLSTSPKVYYVPPKDIDLTTTQEG